jgi:hypothetical protein
MELTKEAGLDGGEAVSLYAMTTIIMAILLVAEHSVCSPKGVK